MTSPDPRALLDLACEAAYHGGVLLRERFEAGTEEASGAKSTPTDLVSEADLASQSVIRALIATRRPDDAFLGEERADVSGTSGLRWVVDPLDGTVNFLFGIPQWCVSVAVGDRESTLAGAIYDPVREETFAAVRGEPPVLNSATVRSSHATELGQAMVATGFAYDATVRAAQGEVLTRLIGRVRDIRRFGSAALDLAWTAAGRFDAYYERGVQPWDIAAGALLCECAGLEVRELPAQGSLPSGLLAATPGVADQLHELVG